MNELVKWAKERESIRKRRQRGEKGPWTKDPILQTYRFCNVRRKDDRVSRWLLKNVLRQWATLDTYIYWTSLCRWINWPPSIQIILDRKLVTPQRIDFKGIAKLLDDMQAQGTKVWTGAYMVSPAGCPKGMTKGEYIVEHVVQVELAKVMRRLHMELSASNPRLERVWSVLRECRNWGDFMAGQVVADWSYTPLLNDATDIYTWAPMGPGSKRGYNRLMGLPLHQPPPKREQWSGQLQEWREDLIKALGQAYVTLTLHDVQNCLCEYDKYDRARKGEGRPRAKYQPETLF